MKTKNLLFLVSFLEGSALMAAELISAKIMTPFYGSSLIVWTSVFVCTLSALAIGYFLGAKISNKSNLEKRLVVILLFSSAYFAIMSPLANFVMENTLSMSIELGSFISVFVFLFPLLVAFGIVSPLIIQLLSSNEKDAGEKSGKVYTISTLGGILTTLFFGFYFIPILGIKLSILLSTALTILAFLLSLSFLKKTNLNLPKTQLKEQ